MTIAFGCILTMVFVPIVLAGYAKFGSKGYDNRNPRDFLEKVQGKFKRAHYAQLNAYEAFAPFAAGVIVAHLSGAAQSRVDTLAVLFVIFRVLFSVFYVVDLHQLRSLVWFLGLLCIVGLFVISF